ncbi:phage tail tape measure C-terminal domain-containing protein [Afipia carboxidovorans]|uniref:phage tail tape measure C-terminal domain-containing protein n=1 Tax=Afipia carboxidovorans TaxID=40137 RepID=UPI0030890CBB|nr:hypothetical protein CRBSH125_00980 [Afipia carboxidovorans]
MADLATLGLAVDSSQVKSATSALQDFSKAATTAEGSARNVGKATNEQASAFAKVKGPAGEFARNFTALDDASGKYDKTTNRVINSLANQYARITLNGRALAQYNAVQNLGANTNEQVVRQVSNAAGALYDLEQRQISAGRSASVLAGKLRLIVGGAIIGGIAALGRHVWSLNDALDAVNTVAGRTGINSANLQGMIGTAGRAGVGESDFLAGMSKFNLEVDKAQRGTGQLYELLKRNGQAVGTVEQSFLKVADLVMNARSEAQKFVTLQQAGLPANEELVRLMEQGAEAIRRQTDAAKANGQIIDQELLNKASAFNQMWTEAWSNFSVQSRAAIATAVDGISSLFSKTERYANWFGNADFWKNFYTPESMKAAGVTPVNRFDAAFQGGQPANSGLTSDLMRRAAQIRGDTTKDDPIKAQKSAFDQAVISINKHIAATNADADAVGKTAAEHARLRVEAQLVEAGLRSGLSEAAVRSSADFKRLGDAAGEAAQKLALARINNQIKFDRNTAFLTQEDVQIASQLRDIYPNVADAMGSVEAQAMRMNNAMREVSQAIENNLTSGLTDIVSGTKSVKDGFSDMANSIIKEIERMVIKMMVVQPIVRSLQAAMGGFGFSFASGGTFGAGLSTTNHTGLYAKGGVFANDNVRAFANGGAFTNSIVSSPTLFRFAQGTGLMGEAGPEAIMPLKRGPDGSLGVRAAGGGAPVINIINQTSGKVEQGGTRRNADGSIDVFIRDAVRGVMLDDAAKNGDISKAMSARMAGFNGR